MPSAGTSRSLVVRELTSGVPVVCLSFSTGALLVVPLCSPVTDPLVTFADSPLFSLSVGIIAVGLSFPVLLSPLVGTFATRSGLLDCQPVSPFTPSLLRSSVYVNSAVFDLPFSSTAGLLFSSLISIDVLSPTCGFVGSGTSIPFSLTVGNSGAVGGTKSPS